MAYTTPRTWVAGEVATAANLNAHLRDNTAWLLTDKPRASAYNNANLTISHNTATVVTLNSERYDTGACHDTGVNTSRLTVPSGGAGVYRIGGCVTWTSNATGTRYLQILYNGTVIICTSQVNAAGTSEAIGHSVYREYSLVAGDYVELRVYQFSGGNLDIVSTNATSPEFWFGWEAT